ncbi:S-adenosyl-L-methionine-dependent methyltransferase [Papiliotrema laurentii]|uniref:catechol O-methyltransferase n=1 Tax=Papiliotrema laurentii TaxID=5418 RepID=A0AAD9FQY0_PAPLA|nr:S-adenosyl-L-methionine-dependent methyltransferase [Papiliotrema laurentii]
MVNALDTTPRQPPPKYHEPVQGTVYHGDGREEALLKHLRSLPSLSPEATSGLSLQERSQRVLDAIHEFGKGENRYLMSVGETKGKQVEDLLKQRKPKLVLELGAYVGYSGISFSRHLLELHPNSVYPGEWASTSSEDRAGYITLEKSDVYAATAQGAFELAGVDKAVKIVVGSSTPNLRNLRKILDMPRPLQFDMVFLDHLKPLYTIDLKVLEEEGLVGPGTVLVADNVVKPGNPAYLSYVRATPSLRRQSLQSPRLTKQPAPTPNPSTDDEWNTAFREGPIDETRWAPDEAEGITADGDPSLVYTSQMLDGWDPYTGEKDACEVSVCTGREEK